MSSSTPAAVKPRTRWPALAILVMVVLFVLVVVKRDGILSRWWVYRLRNSTTLVDRAYYVAGLAGVGDAASDALESLGNDDRAENRSLVLPASQGMSLAHRLPLLRRCLFDVDPDIRLSAATAVSFLKPEVAAHHLSQWSRSDEPRVAAAALAGLARVNTSEALAAICEAAVKNSNPWIRAQAIESIGQQLSCASPPSATAPAEMDSCDPVDALLASLEDTGEFSEKLALEIEMEAAQRAVASTNGLPTTTQGSPVRRTVRQVAAATLTTLTGDSHQPQSLKGLTADGRKLLRGLIRSRMTHRQSLSRPSDDQ